MTDDEKLLARAKAIHRELRLRRPTILQQWMVQYIAECIEKLESGTGTPRLANQCADTIARLWKTQVQLQKTEVKRGVNYYLKRTRLDAKASEALRVVLETPGRAPQEVTPESAITMWQLAEVEHLVLQILWAVARRRRADRVDDEQEGEADRFDEIRERVTSEAQQQLASILPAVGTAPLDDYETVLRIVTAALRSIDQVRQRLLWSDSSSTSHEAQAATDSKDTPPEAVDD
ncbi:MAG TPA: hypothetical protein VF883_02995 [Thermoanaerobaculia bacterium]|jgi:hypothetical protein